MLSVSFLMLCCMVSIYEFLIVCCMGSIVLLIFDCVMRGFYRFVDRWPCVAWCYRFVDICLAVAWVLTFCRCLIVCYMGFVVLLIFYRVLYGFIVLLMSDSVWHGFYHFVDIWLWVPWVLSFCWYLIVLLWFDRYVDICLCVATRAVLCVSLWVFFCARPILPPRTSLSRKGRSYSWGVYAHISPYR